MNTIDDLIRNLQGLKKDVMRDIPPQIGRIMLDQTQRSFEEQRFAGDPGSRWDDRRAFGGEENINYPKLVFSGRLKRSFRRVISRLGRNNTVVSVGTNVPYARAHNEGGYAPYHVGRRTQRSGHVKRGVWKYSGGVPQRQFLGVGTTTAGRIMAAMNRFFRMYRSKL